MTLRAPCKNSALNQSRKCEVVRPHFWSHKKHQKLRTRRCTSTVLHGMAGAVGANVAGHLLGVGGNHKLNLAGRSCTCELNLVSKILCFTTLKTSIFLTPELGSRTRHLMARNRDVRVVTPTLGSHFGTEFGVKDSRIFCRTIGFQIHGLSNWPPRQMSPKFSPPYVLRI